MITTLNVWPSGNGRVIMAIVHPRAVVVSMAMSSKRSTLSGHRWKVGLPSSLMRGGHLLSSRCGGAIMRAFSAFSLLVLERVRSWGL